MEHSLIQPVAVNGQEPTCFAALTVMVKNLGCDAVQLEATLKECSIPIQGNAEEWTSSLMRAQTWLEYSLRKQGQGEAKIS